MATWLHAVCFSGGFTFGDGLTRFFGLAGEIYSESTEANVQTRVREATDLQNLYVRILTNSLVTASTWTLRVNGATDTTLEVSVPAGLTGVFEDTTGTVTVVDGDLVNTIMVTPAGSGSIEVSVISYTLISDNPMLIAILPFTFNPSTSAFYSPVGAFDPTTVETRAEYTMRASLTLSNLRLFVSANSITAASTYVLRKNQANGNMSVSIPASTTGAFEDTVNTDAVVSGDEINTLLTTGAGHGGISITVNSSTMKSSSPVAHLGCAQPGTTGVFANNIAYFPISGRIATQDTFTEADTKVKTRTSFTAADLMVNINSNTVDGASTVTLRKNGAATALSVSIPASTSGIFEDASTEEFGNADDINFEENIGGASGALVIGVCGFEFQPVVDIEMKGIGRGIARGAARGVG